MTATVIGATGLIGGYVLDELLADEYFNSVRILVRRPVDLSHPKLVKKFVDFSDEESFRLALEGSNVVFCAIGTTQKKVKGDKDAYRKIDYDITVNAAKFCRLGGCDIFVFVSAIGANSKSSNFYLRLKGEIEDAVKQTGLRSVHIMQPSLLTGDRKEFRLGERISYWMMTIFSLLISSKYKAVDAKKVAKAMVAAAKNNTDGNRTYQYRDF